MSDLSELFLRDPMSLTKLDIDKIITYYREKRAQFNAGIKPTKEEKPKTKGSSPEINLGELDL